MEINPNGLSHEMEVFLIILQVLVNFSTWKKSVDVKHSFNAI